MNFSNFKIGSRLAAGFGGVLLAGLAVVAVGSLRLNAIEHETTLLVQDRMVKVAQANDILGLLNQVARRARNIALGTDSEQMRAEQRLIEEAGKRAATLFKQLDEGVRDPQSRQLLEQAGKVRGPYAAAMGKAIGLAQDFKTAEATQALTEEGAPLLEAYLQALQGLVERQQALMQESAEQVRAVARGTTGLMLAIAAIATTLGALVAWSLTRSITHPIAHAVSLANAAAAGDLTHPITTRGRDEVAQLLHALARMQQALADVVGQVRQGAHAVASASTQIAQGNQDLSGRTESQASALEETAASMEELGSTVRQNADSARQANQLAQSASSVAEQGGQVVAQVVQTMRQIDTDSHRIADIIGVIDSIAFQTNILALNAAVEAARAGEQGRGFAVVAGEVRSLAQRSASAAKEIKGLIGTSVERVEHGTQLVDKAGATMAEVVGAIRRVTDIMGEISAASGEQSAGVSQVSEAVTQMDQATQQNAALVEQMAAAAASLNHQAHDLVQAVGVFKLADGDAPVDAAPAPRVEADALERQAVPALAAQGAAWERF